MIHYHGTPISPRSKFPVGRHYCVSFAAPKDVDYAHQKGQSVLLDNGAFSFWKSGTPTNWKAYYEWCDKYLNYPTTWAIIPDIIDARDIVDNVKLIREWPHGNRGAPVWHLHEGFNHLLDLLDHWPRVCFGSSGQYSQVGSPSWHRRVERAWNEIAKRHQRTPWLHMLRGMQASRWDYPFASVDSTDVARNHNREQNTPIEMCDRWDQIQPPPIWNCREELNLSGISLEDE